MVAAPLRLPHWRCCIWGHLVTWHGIHLHHLIMTAIGCPQGRLPCNLQCTCISALWAREQRDTVQHMQRRWQRQEHCGLVTKGKLHAAVTSERSGGQTEIVRSLVELPLGIAHLITTN